MFILPGETPVTANLNSYYLDIRRLLEHCEGELGSGGIHFKSPSAEAIVFFDNDAFLGGVFQEKEGQTTGRKAVDRLLDKAPNHNFIVNIYQLGQDKVYFFSNIPYAEKIYKDLSSEFTDLEGLVKRMSAEKLTGYIEASIGDGREGGLIFLNKGEIIGSIYSWGQGKLNGSRENQELLVTKIKEAGGTFHVSRIPLTKRAVESEQRDEKGPLKMLVPLEEMLKTLEGLVISKKKTKREFQTLLKKKLVENADKYVFLDPFVAEFEYADQKISFSGQASDLELADGVIECVKQMAKELEILPQFLNELTLWSEKYGTQLDELGISV